MRPKISGLVLVIFIGERIGCTMKTACRRVLAIFKGERRVCATKTVDAFRYIHR